MLIELAAVAVDHGPDRRQRLGQPLVGDGQVHLVHLHRREGHRPQHQGRIGLDLLLHPQLVQGVHHLVQPHLQPQVDGRHVEGAGQRIHQRHALAELAVVVLRGPDLAILAANADRLIFKRRAQSQAVGETGQVDRGLDQRAYLAAGIQRPVEAGVARIPAPHHGHHLALVPVGDHHGRLQLLLATLLLDGGQTRLHRLLGGVLGDGIQTGEDLEAGLFEQIRAEAALDLPLEQPHEGRGTAITHLAAGNDAERLLAGQFILGRLQAAVIHQQLEHQITARLGPLREAPGIVIGGALHHAHQQGHLIDVQLVDRNAEVEVGGEPEAIDPLGEVLPQIDLVEVGFQDLVLAVAIVDEHRHVGFLRLAPQAAFPGQEEVLGQLLGQGTAALHGAPRQQVGRHGAHDGHRRDAAVLVEVPILGGEQCDQQAVRHLGEAHQQAILPILGVEAIEQHRVHLGVTELTLVLQRLDPLQPRAVEGEAQAAGGIGPVMEGKRPANKLDAVAAHRILARGVGLAHLLVAQHVELAQHLGLGEALAGIELQRPAVDHHWQLPLLAVEAFTHLGIQVDAKHHHEGRSHQGELEAQPEQRAPDGAFGRHLLGSALASLRCHKSSLLLFLLMLSHSRTSDRA